MVSGEIIVEKKHFDYVDPKELSLFMQEAGLIQQEEQNALESYLWNTAFEEVF